MEVSNIVYIEGVGLCEEITQPRTNEDGISTPYTIYLPL